MSRGLVMGTGRTGSHYLHHMMQRLGFDSIHEESRKFRGSKYIEGCDWEGAGDWLCSDDNRVLCGFPYGLMVHYLRHRVPELRVICVQRDKDSWLKSTNVTLNLENASSWPRNLESLEHYWEIYYHLAKTITEPVLHLTMADLNECEQVVKEFMK